MSPSRCRPEVSFPHLGPWARFRLRERRSLACGQGGITWSMAVVLANLLGASPEYPRLRVLELGAGTGLAALAAAGPRRESAQRGGVRSPAARATAGAFLPRDETATGRAFLR